MKNKAYKDKCDKCNQMKICKGFNSLVLCEDCRKKEAAKAPKIIGDKDGQTKFNF